jgi:trehalose transport system substrate-binding protein
MSGSNFDEIYREALAGKLNRREVLKRAGLLGLSIPAISMLLAACTGDDDDVTETPAPEAPPTPAGTDDDDDTDDDETETPDDDDDTGADDDGEWTREYEGTTVRWSTSLAESEREVFDNIILPEFEDLTGISVQFLQIEAADVIRQLEAQVQANRVEIDLVAIDNNSLAPLVANNLIEDLSDFEDDIPDETIEASLPVLRFDETLYFLPYRPNVQINYYNTGAFEEYELEPPRTWEELLDVARTFQEEEGIGRIAVQGSPEGGGGPVGVTVTEFIWQAGGDPLELNSPEAIEAFTFLQELAPYLSPQTATAKFDTMNTYMANDSIYLGRNWPFGVNVIVQEAGRDDIHSYSNWGGPAGPISVLGGEVSAIPNGSPNRDAALVFARYLMSRDVQETLTRELAWPAVREDAYGVVEEWQQPYFDAIREAMENTMARPNVTYWGAVQGIMADAWARIVENGEDIETVLNDAQEQLEREAGA